MPDGRLRVGNSLRTGGELGGAWLAAAQAPLWTAATVAWADADAAGERLLVCDSRGVRLIRLADGEMAWRAEVGAVARVGVAAGDRAGWAVGYDGTLLVFDLADGAVTGRVATGTQLRSIDQHGGLGTNLAFTPDGSTLLSVGDDVHIGALRVDRPAREAAARAALARGERTAAIFAALDWWERAR